MHADKERLYRYLSGALSGDELRMLEAHLLECSVCSESLAEVAAEDAMLTDALGIDAGEEAWIESIDLVEPVMAQVAPRFQLTPPIILTSLLVILGGHLAGSLWSLGTALLPDLNSMRAILGLAHDLGPALLRLLLWLGQGGLLTTLWPLLAAGAAYGLWRLLQTKETSNHA